VGFELTIAADERPQTYALYRVAAWIGTSERYQLSADSNN